MFAQRAGNEFIAGALPATKLELSHTRSTWTWDTNYVFKKCFQLIRLIVVTAKRKRNTIRLSYKVLDMREN